MALHFLSDAAAAASPGGTVVLDGGEAHHAATVRRLRRGEAVTVGDGCGVWLEGTVDEIAPREVVVRVVTRRDVAAPTPRLVLVQALAKGDRDELAVQAATELGVDVIVPWQAERSISRWDGKADKGVARWRTIVREAVKQAHRPWLPEVADPVDRAGLVALAATTRMLILDPGAACRLSAADLTGQTRDVAFVVGPEGGVSEAELSALSVAGATPVRLGPTVLRTSTAGAAAIAVANVALGRW
ncbi:16S rRNA (uracil(1498)-N(3))-methyltransferase [Microbacterium sp. RD1]|uniref:16S rRNA (uracil(1498)-N(3))-methyltransferase n=1 Tax=Microbacterium sp. RD1 TaxID=3457313 RepID=UPI003FA565D7